MKLKVPQGSFKAYLFDCDGTVVDSMPLHYIAWKKALGEWNCEFDEQLFYAWGGMPIAEIISALNQRHGLSMSVETVSHRKESLYFELLPQLKAVPEVLEHIDAQHGRIPFAVVSGSTRQSVMASLFSLKLLDRFDTLVCAEDYGKSKPDPPGRTAEICPLISFCGDKPSRMRIKGPTDYAVTDFDAGWASLGQF